MSLVNNTEGKNYRLGAAMVVSVAAPFWLAVSAAAMQVTETKPQDVFHAAQKTIAYFDNAPQCKISQDLT